MFIDFESFNVLSCLSCGTLVVRNIQADRIACTHVNLFKYKYEIPCEAHLRMLLTARQLYVASRSKLKTLLLCVVMLIKFKLISYFLGKAFLCLFNFMRKK